ncbi:hypothetical protein [Isoptericola chiayiensis]|uniref:hypothetical protein n=1 Tax=Isoptericola chiayiensis TaxID=579446 RepID=UPI0031E77867
MHAPIPPAPTERSAPVQSPAPAPAPVRAPSYPAGTQQWAPQAPPPAPAPHGHQQPSAPPQSPQQYGYTPQQYAYQQAGGPPPTTQSPAVGDDDRRRRLTPGWIAFILLDVVLVVVMVVLAFDLLGGPDDSGEQDPVAGASQDAGTDTSGEDGTGDEAAQDAAGEQVAEFASPSRNITCQVYENEVSCGLAELDQQPAPVEGCDGTTGYVVTLDSEGKVALPCVAKGDKPKTAPKKTSQLAYGDSRTDGDFTCTSEQDGMYCEHDPTGNGFSLARAGVGTY